LASHSKASQPEPGRVLGAAGGVYDVQRDDGSVVEARLRGRLKLEQRTGDRIVSGDSVTLEPQHDTTQWTIESVAPRRSVLARRAPGKGSRRAKILVANIDQVAIVVAAARPEPKLRTVDRLLVLAESNELAALIVVNKTDLGQADEIARRFAPYSAAGYTVLLTSAEARTGLDALAEQLCGRDSVLTGPSGVGKSSLLNALEPGLGLRVAAIGDAAGKGRHTTVSAKLVPLGCGGYLADTPGLREVGLWDVEHDNLPHYFPEFRTLAPECRFSGCTHVHEPRCAVLAGVESGAVDRDRYDSYVAMLNDEPVPEW
jgi:ribosome biogenesis GTPase / thiamine phosphate phosphatase